MSMQDFLDDVIRSWQEMRPAIPLQVHFDAAPGEAIIFVERTLRQAITHLLDNAADASPSGIEVRASWTGRELDLQIMDQGAGLPPQKNIGEAFVTTKENGQGLGIYLSRTVIEGMGGSIHIANRETGGVVAQIRLPVVALQELS
jgi:two-component system, sensor histidine kinase RegB